MEKYEIFNLKSSLNGLDENKVKFIKYMWDL